MYYGANTDINKSLDEKLDILFDHKTNGIYVELGAFDGIEQSNTKFFEDTRNWSGILIEPSTRKYELCLKNRPKSLCYNYACVNESDISYLIGDWGNIMSSANGKRNKKKYNPLTQIAAKTLENILDNSIEHFKTNFDKNLETDIDFISIDTEGYEYNVLCGLNLLKYKPKYLLIEIYIIDYDKIINYLKQYNYTLHSNFSNYNLDNNKRWDGTHNDYLFKYNSS